MKLALILLLQAAVSFSVAQTNLKDRKINIEVKDISLETLIEKLLTEHQINIVYGFDNVNPSAQRFSIKVSSIGITELMSLICNHFNLSFELVNNYIILSPGAIQQTVTRSPIPNSSQKTLIVAPNAHSNDTTKEVSKSEVSILTVIKDDKKDSVVFIKVAEQKRNDSSGVAKLSVKPRKKAHHFIAGVLALDNNDYNFRDLADPNQEYKSKLSISYALSYYRSISEKFQIALGFMYSSKEFSYNRNFKILVVDDPVSIPNTTTLSHTYLEVPIEAVYHIKKSSIASISALSGFNPAFLTSKKETTEYLTNGDPNTKYFIENSNSFLLGAFVGVRFSMKVYNQLSIFCEPRYIKYFQTVNSSVMDSGTGLFRANVGLSIQLDNPR